MFDLFRSRAKAVRYLLGALLLLVALSMVVTLIPGYGSGGNASDYIVAEIGKETLTTRDVQVVIQSQIRNKAFPADMAEQFIPQIINQLIAERAVAYEAQRMGFQVTESDVATTIRTMLPDLFQGGKFVGADIYAEYLSRMNTSIPEFESNVRKQLLLNDLQSLVLEGIVVTPKEVENEFRRRNEKVKLEYVAVAPEKYADQVKPTREEMLAYFNKNRPSYQIPEKRSFQMLVVDEAKIAQSISVPEAQLRAMYEAQKDRFRTPERVKVRHILLKTTDKPKEDVSKIEAKAEDILKQLKAGANFADLAKKYSDDPGSAAKGGDLGWIARGQTVKNFENVAFSLKPNQLSNVIKTEYGFHIIQVLEKEDAHLKSFEEVKPQLEAERKKQLVYDRMQTLSDQARAELVKAPLHAETIANKLGLELVNVEKLGRNDPIPQVGKNPDFEDAIFSLSKGGVTPVVQVGQSKLVVATLTDVYPPRPAEFAEAEQQVRQQLVTQKSQELASERSKELAEKLKAGGNDLAKVARSMGLEVKTSAEFTREQGIEGFAPAGYFLQAFDEPVGAVVGPVNVSGETAFAKVIEKVPADMSKLPSQRETILNSLKSDKARVRTELFQDGLVARLIQQGKVKIYEDTVKRLVASYRG
jgi:peptidyl-prolyl cis-trans isomerase D